MATINATTKQVVTQPSAFIFQIGLILEFRSTEHLSEVVSRYQPCCRIDRPNGLHRQNYRSTLIQQRSRESSVVAGMRVPVPVEAAEARSRDRLVYRRITFDKRVAFCYSARVGCQLFGEF